MILIVAVAVSSSQAFRAKRAEESARERAKDAAAIKDFLVRHVLDVNPYVEPEPDPGRRARVDRVAREAETEFADRPKIEAEIRFALGIVYTGLADSREAVNQFEKAYAIRRDELGPQHSDTLWALAAIAQSYPAIGRSQEAKQLMTLVSFSAIAFSAEQAQQCDALVQSLQQALPTVSTNQHLWHRTIATMQLRRGQFPESLAHLEIALELQKPGPERARLLLLKAMNLYALARPNEARAAFDEAEAFMKPRLLDDLPEREGFLNHNERTYLIFHREAQALLGLK